MTRLSPWPSTPTSDPNLTPGFANGCGTCFARISGLLHCRSPWCCGIRKLLLYKDKLWCTYYHPFASTASPCAFLVLTSESTLPTLVASALEARGIHAKPISTAPLFLLLFLFLFLFMLLMLMLFRIRICIRVSFSLSLLIFLTLSLSIFACSLSQGVGVLRSFLPGSLFEHVSMG